MLNPSRTPQEPAYGASPLSGLQPMRGPEDPMELLLSTLPHVLAPTTPTSYFAAWLRYCVDEAGVTLPPRGTS